MLDSGHDLYHTGFRSPIGRMEFAGPWSVMTRAFLFGGVQSISWGREEEEDMEEKKKCPLFREPEGLSFGKGIGYCDIDSDSTTCEGNVKLCEKPDALKRYLLRKLNDFGKKENKGE